MRLTPRRVALALAIAASVALPPAPASADPATKCFYLPALYLQGRPAPAGSMALCVPWPLP